MMTVTQLLIGAAFVTAIADTWLSVTIIMLLLSIVAIVVAAIGKCPLWVGVLLLWVTVALTLLPK